MALQHRGQESAGVAVLDDRRIRVHDLLEFESRRERDRRELAQRFASQPKTRDGAIDEVADLL